MANMSPLSDEQLEPFKPLFDAMKGKMGFVPNSLKTMARKPKLLQLFVEFALESSRDDEVSTQLKYMLGIIASNVSGCRYCQAHLSVTAEIEDIADEKIAQLWLFEDSELFSEAERVALRFARDAAMQPNEVTNAHFSALYQHYNEGQVVEMLAIVCLFRWLNCWNDSMATELEAMPMAKAKSVLSEQGWEAGKHA